MSWVAAAIAGSTLVNGYISSKSASKAADSQSQSAQAGIDEQRRQFDAVRKLLQPYVSGGNAAFGQQQNLLGLNGAGKQQSLINSLASSPQMQALTQQGENAILQNASATGGLRGGNTQAALAQFRPQMLSNLIQQQFSNLGSLSSMGQNAAAGVGNAGMQTGSNISNLLQQQGAAQAGAALAQGQATQGVTGGLMSALGYLNNAPPRIETWTF